MRTTKIKLLCISFENLSIVFSHGNYFLLSVKHNYSTGMLADFSLFDFGSNNIVSI